jgi:hypothetical protein
VPRLPGGTQPPRPVPPDREAPIRPIARWTALALLALAAQAGAQRPITLQTRAVLYGDNTEFFTPYRTGETILGAQVTSWLDARPGDRTAVRLGFFADRRAGSEEFVDSIKPVLAFRYQTQHTLAVLGTLETERRHGLLEPLMVTTRELTTPIEYGMQVVETRARFRGEAWINWQKLNTPSQREQFELGLTARGAVGRGLGIEAQHLWLHRGGQLFDAGVPVSNNRVTALGLIWRDTLPRLHGTSLAVHRLWSTGHIDPNYPADRPGKGTGTYVRAAVSPWGVGELFGIWWRGRDFVGNAGDNNYNSTGEDPDFYRSRRKYVELGFLRRVPIEGGVSFDAEVRFHRIDDEDTGEAFFGTPWEFSYRLVARVPVEVVLRR